jgi:hypothetical protein
VAARGGARRTGAELPLGQALVSINLENWHEHLLPGSREPGRSLATTATGWFTSRSSLPDVRGFPTSSRATTFLEQLARRALAVVEGGWHLAEDFSRIGEQVSGIEAKRPCYLTLCL